MSDRPARLRVLLTLAWPVVLARATQAVIGFTDAWMVSPLGKDSLAATTTGALDSFAFIIFWTGTAQIVQSFAAQLTGRGRRDETRRYAWYGLAIAAAAMLLALAAIPLLPTILGLTGATPHVRALMSEYLAIRLLSIGGAVGLEVIGTWYAGLGNTRIQLLGGIVAMVTNVLLCWVLIRGHLGAPALGVAGSAWAAVIASWLGFAVLAILFHRGAGGAPKPEGPLGLRWSEVKRFVRFGVPNGVNWFLEFAAFLVFVNVVVVDLGTEKLAAMQVVLQINSVSFMPAFGIASAGAILAGQAIGAGERDRVRPIVFLTMKVAAVWEGAVGLIYLVFASPIVGGFGALAGAVVMLRLSSAWQLFDAAAMTLGEVLRAAGDTTWPMYARMILAWVVFVPVGVMTVTVAGGGEVAAMMCLLGYLAILAGILAMRFRAGAWRRIELTAEPDLLA